MAKISTYPIVSIPTLNDLLIGTDVENLNETKNFSLADIQSLIVTGSYVPYTGAIQDVDLGSYGITANYFTVPGGLSTQFLKADGSVDSTSYQPSGNYITGLSGEASASGPGVANVTLNNGAVIGKVLTGLSVTGGSISSTDSILQAFGKLQNQVNSLYGGAIYQGTWDASTNTPTLTSGVGTQGWYYIVNVAGSTNLDGITDWNVGDWAIFDGTAWQQVDNTDTVVSVNGQVGVVVLTTTNIAEGTNLYYLDSRARAAITLTTSGNSGASSYSSVTGILNVPNYTISGLGGVPTSRTLTINGTSYDLSANRTWSVGTVTSVGTSAPLTGGTITGSGTIGITQAGVSTDGYLSSTDWNTFNNKQNALTNPVTGTGTLYYIPMWTGASALSDSIISYSSSIVNFNYNSALGGTINYINTGGTTYTYTIQMNNFGSPRQTYHSYTDGNVLQQINGNVVSKNLQSGQLVLPYYTTTSSFAGTVAGYLGFDSAGNILTFAGPSLTGYVPYTGATQDVNLGEFGLTAGQLTLDTSPTGTAVVGTTRWNNDIGSSETTLKGGSVILKNGVDLVARVVNKVFPNTTLTKAAYQAVRVSGAQGQRLAVSYAQADGDPNSADTLGLVCETIPTNQEGFIITVGQLEGINTTGSLQGETWSDGDVLYLSPTTPGAITNIKPNASTGHIVIIGYVEYAHINNGKIYVKIMNGWELDELHNVYINNPLNNQGLFYTSSTQLWQNKSIDTALGYTPVNKAGDTMTGYLILNADPVNSLGAATKEYVDNLVNGIDWKQAANAGTVASLPTYIVSGGGQVLTGFANGAIPSATTDGVTLVVGNRVLVKSETSTLTPNNGIYVVTQAGSGSQPFILTRSSDANTSALLSEATLSISGGFTLSNTQWHCNPAATPIVIGSTYITFTQIGSGVYFGTAPISVSGNTISISQSNISTDGYLSSTDWNTFNSKQNTITLTTTGSSGSATFISNTLNVPTYTLNGLGGASATTTLTINGDSYDLSANRTWSVGTVTSVAALTLGTTGTDLSSSVATGTTTPVITLNVPTASATNRGALSSTDWSTFNSKQDAITLTTTGTSGAATLVGSTLNIPQYQSVITNPVTGLGVTNELTFWTSSTSIGNLSTAIYPSLTEISYVKGVTSDIQSQINSKQATISLTTVGTSGAATLIGATLNIPQYQAELTNPVTGTGTFGQVAYFNGSTSITGSNGLVFDGTNLGIGLAAPAQKLTVNGDVSIATILNAVTDTDKFLVSDGGIIKYRTGSEVLSDIGGQAALTNPVTGTGTTNELTYWTSSSAVGSLSTATYPSLTELSYVKGVTSSIQTQLNGKQGTLTLTTTGTSGAATLVGNTLNIPQYSGGGGGTARNELTYTATAGQTTFAATYVVGQVDVYYNGSKLAPAEFTATNGTSIVLAIPTFVNDIVNIISYVTSVVPGISGSLNYVPKFSSSTSIANSQIFDDGANVGVNTITPSYRLDVNGTGRYQDNLLVSKNGNAGTSLTISNTTSGTASNSNILLTSDASAGSAVFGKRSSTYTPASVYSSSDFVIINGSTAGNLVISNEFATGTIRFAAGGSTTAQLTIAANGNITQSVNQNNPTVLNISNSTSGIGAQSQLKLTTDGGTFWVAKRSSGAANYKFLNTNDSYLYNDTAGDISILNDFATGTIKLGAGGSSTAQAVIKTTGQLQLNNYTSTSSFTGTAAGYLAFDSSGNILSAAVPSSSTVTFNRQTSSYTLALSDAGKMVEMNVGTANNLTVPLNSSIAFPIGTQIDVTQYGAGQTTFVATAGVTIRSTNGWLKMNAQYGAATLVKVGTDEWYLFGNINA